MTPPLAPLVRTPLRIHPWFRALCAVLGIGLLVFGVLAVFVPGTSVAGGVAVLVLAALLFLAAVIGIVPPRFSYKDVTVDLVLETLSPEAQVEYLRGLLAQNPQNPEAQQRLQQAEEAVSYEDDVLSMLESLPGADLARDVPVSAEGRGRKLRLDAVVRAKGRRVGIEVRQRGLLSEYRTPVERLLQALGANDIDEGLIITDEPEHFRLAFPAPIKVIRPTDLRDGIIE